MDRWDLTAVANESDAGWASAVVQDRKYSRSWCVAADFASAATDAHRASALARALSSPPPRDIHVILRINDVVALQAAKTCVCGKIVMHELVLFIGGKVYIFFEKQCRPRRLQAQVYALKDFYPLHHKCMSQQVCGCSRFNFACRTATTDGNA
jgi:hypothetical protein